MRAPPMRSVVAAKVTINTNVFMVKRRLLNFTAVRPVCGVMWLPLAFPLFLMLVIGWVLAEGHARASIRIVQHGPLNRLVN